jgi:phage shock protein PspC (stress-responsive transcriptional regulator)
MLAGVCGGLADHLGLDPLHVRVAFALLAALSGFGLLLYGAYWIVVPQERPDETAPAGIAAASRRGLRERARRRAEDTGQLVALLVLGVGLVLLLHTTPFGLSPNLLWPALVVAAGLALLWRQADEVPTGVDQPEAAAAAPWWSLFAGGSRWVMVLRLVGGVALVGVGLGSFLAVSGGLRLQDLGQVVFGVAIVLLGATLMIGPWLLRTWRTLAEERRDRIRTQAHADLAAHLHDSVLQTLALIQKQAGDPREVIRLARSQERDLRGFLYGEAAPAEESLAAALRRVGAEVEDDHRVPVEVVTVGDAPLDDRMRALLAAAREAMVNAARHAGADAVDVFAETDPATVTVFVRDRGKGFDLTTVPDDRMGLRHSIVGRMERHGGRATVRTAPGEGTEVRLEMDRS